MAKSQPGFLPQKTASGVQPRELFYTLFEPGAQQVKATILILHGMKEHSGRYHPFAQWLADKGFAVLVYDHLGHGRTAKSSEELGFFQLQNPAKQLVNDAALMMEYLEQSFPKKPHFLLGHSMGSFIARCLLQQQGARFDGAVLVGTGDKNPIAGFSKGILSLLNMLAPKRRSKIINKAFDSVNNQRFKKENDERSWLSVNPENREAFLKDPLCGVDFSNNGFYTLLSLNIKATEKNWAVKIPKELPVLFVSGAEDPIGDFSRGAQQTAKALQGQGFKDVSVKLYPGMRHEILNEQSGKTYTRIFMIGWQHIYKLFLTY